VFSPLIGCITGKELAAYAQLVSGAAHSFLSNSFATTRKFKENSTWKDWGYPTFNSTFSLTHTNFQWLLGE
jgi:hypothetical protein